MRLVVIDFSVDLLWLFLNRWVPFVRCVCALYQVAILLLQTETLMDYVAPRSDKQSSSLPLPSTTSASTTVVELRS